MWKDDNRSVIVHLKPTKTVRSGAGVFLEIHIASHPYSGIRLLRRLWDARHLDIHPRDFVFCRIDHRSSGGTLIPSAPATGNAYRRLIKRLVLTIGLDPHWYSGHSLRSGGATDLFATGTPYYVIKKFGRWTSDAALLYFRSEADVARQASKAFNVMVK